MHVKMNAQRPPPRQMRSNGFPLISLSIGQIESYLNSDLGRPPCGRGRMDGSILCPTIPRGVFCASCRRRFAEIHHLDNFLGIGYGNFIGKADGSSITGACGRGE